MIYLVLVWLLSVSTFALDMENIIDGNMDLRVNNIKEDFYPLFIDEEKEEGFLGLKDLFYILELSSLKVDIKERRVYGELPNKESIDWKFRDEVAFIEDSEIYLNVNNLNEVVPVKSVDFNLHMLKLEIKLDFKLPSDIRYEQELKRKNILKKERLEEGEKDFVTNSKIISPGVVQLQYEQSDLSKGDNNSLSLEYSTQLLYGEFQSEMSIFNKRSDKDEFKINTASLRYNNAFDQKDVVLGSFYMRTPGIYNIDNNLNGISILDSSDRYDLSERDGNIFEGYAEDGAVVELYRNGILIDYQNVSNQRYSFKGIDLLSLTDRYYIRIYDESGEYIQKDLSLLMNNKILPKGRWSYSLQSGKVREGSESNFIGNLKYGLSRNLTTDFGYYNLTGSRGEAEYEEISYGFIYNSNPIKFPFWISANWYQDLNAEDGSLILDFNQNIYDFKIEGTFERYSQKIAEQERKDEEYRVNLKKSIKNMNYGVGYGVENYKGDKYNNYTTGIGYNLRSVSNSFEYTFQEYTENSSRNKHRFRYQLGSGGFEVVNITSSVEFKYNSEWELEEDKYTIKFVKRNSSYYNSKKMDFSVNFTYSEKSRDKFLSELSFTLYLEEFGLPFTSAELLFTGDSNDQKKLGTKVRKTILLEDVTKDSKMRNISNSWLKGRVFIDYNGNGKYDDMDEILDGVDVVVQGKSVTTDENGEYFMENISSNSLFNLKLDRTYIDPLLYFDETKHYSLKPSTGMRIDIPLQNTTSMSGGVKLISDEIDESKLPFILNRVNIKIFKGNEEIKSFKPEFDGFFICDGLVDGDYRIVLSIADDNYYFEKLEYHINVTSSDYNTGIYYLDDFELFKRESSDEKSEEIMTEEEDVWEE